MPDVDPPPHAHGHVLGHVDVSGELVVVSHVYGHYGALELDGRDVHVGGGQPLHLLPEAVE